MMTTFYFYVYAPLPLPYTHLLSLSHVSVYDTNAITILCQPLHTSDYNLYLPTYLPAYLYILHRKQLDLLHHSRRTGGEREIIGPTMATSRRR